MPPFDFSFSTLPYESYRGDELDLLAALDQPHQRSGTQTPSTDWLLSLTNFQSSNGLDALLPSGSGLSTGSALHLHGASRDVSPGPGSQEGKEGKNGSAMDVDPDGSHATPSDGGGPEASADNLWPHIYHPTAPVTHPLALPPVASTSESTLYSGEVLQISDLARASMISLVESSHKSPWQDISIASFPSTATLQVCCNLYFQRFHPTFPILLKKDIQEKETQPALLLAIAAIGATYSRDGLEGLGVALTEIVRRALQYLREIDPRLSFQVWVIQAWLLHAVFGLYCGSRKLYQHSEISRCGLVTAARRMDLLRPTCTSVQELRRRKSSPSAAELQNAYLEDEERLRLGWAIYCFDGQISTLLNLQSLFSVSEVTAVLPDDDERFGAPNPASWASFPEPNRPNFRATLDALLTTGKAPHALNPFGAYILSLTLYRLCIDAAAIDSVLSVDAPPATTSPYRLTFSPSIKQNPQALLDSIASSWYNTSSSPTSLLVAATALSHHGAIQFFCGEFLNHVKVAAGKWGSERRGLAQAWLKEKMVKDPVAMRRILCRAAQLNQLLMRYTFDTPSEVVWISDVAMTIWAIVKFGGVGIIEGSNQLSARTSLKWSDSDQTETWIQRGGPISLKGGLGDYATLTPERVLSEFVEKLENLPWGLSRKFRGVLMSLSQEETEEVEEDV